MVREWAKKPIADIAPEIGKILDGYGVVLAKADARPAEYKYKIEKFTKIPIYYIEGNMYKDSMLSQLQRKIRQHQLEIPMHELTLITQLRKYRRGMRLGMTMRMRSPLAVMSPRSLLRYGPRPLWSFLKLKFLKQLEPPPR